MVEFEELKRLKLRQIWKNEAQEFSPWLGENLAHLGERLGMELELTESEASVGDFSLDLLAKGLGAGRPVIIENQLTQTDHDHLGKLLTYAAGFDAATVIWIADAIREEHRQALDWLNQRTDAETQFFGVVVEVLQIGGSKPAFNFRPVVFPNEWQKRRRRRTTKTISTRGEAYRDYFQELIDELREKHKFTGARIAQPQNWYSFASGFTGITYSTSFSQGNRARAEVYIDRGDGEQNDSLFEWLKGQRPEIEAEMQEPLEWEPLEAKRACRIAIYRSGSIDDDAEALREVRRWAVNRLLKLKKAFDACLRGYYQQQS